MTDDIQPRNMARFCDFENIARGGRAAKQDRIEHKAGMGRSLLKGNIVMKKDYAAWVV